MLANTSPRRSPAQGAGAPAARVAGLVCALERLLADTQETLAALTADPLGAGARAPALRRLKDEAARILAELETLVPPERRDTHRERRSAA